MPHLEGLTEDRTRSHAKRVKNFLHYGRQPQKRLGPEDAIRHVTRKHLNNRIESDHAALKRLLRQMRGFRDLASAKATLQGFETFRAIRKAEFEGAAKGVANEIAFVENLFKLAA